MKNLIEKFCAGEPLDDAEMLRVYKYYYETAWQLESFGDIALLLRRECFQRADSARSCLLHRGIEITLKRKEQ